MKEYNYKVFAQNLRYYMELFNIDRYGLCEALNFKYSTVSDWISGKKLPRMDKLEILAIYFKTTVAGLIEEHPESKKSAPTDDGRSKK